MRLHRLAAATTVAGVLAFAGAPRASAGNYAADAQLSRGQLEVLLESVANSAGARGARTFTVRQYRRDPLEDWACSAVIDPIARIVVRNDTGAEVSRTCVEAPVPGNPATMPSVVEVERRLRQEAYGEPFDVTPARGLTGVPSRLSYNGPLTVRVAVNLGGFTATGVAELTRLCWFDGSAQLGCIDGAQRTANLVFRVRGQREITLRATWHGIASVKSESSDEVLAIVPLGDDVVTTTTVYPVASAEAIIN